MRLTFTAEGTDTDVVDALDRFLTALRSDSYGILASTQGKVMTWSGDPLGEWTIS